MSDENRIPEKKLHNPYEPKAIHLIWKIPLWLAAFVLIILFVCKPGISGNGYNYDLGVLAAFAAVSALALWLLFHFLMVRYKGKLVSGISFAAILVVIAGISYFRLSALYDKQKEKKEISHKLYLLLSTDLRSDSGASYVNGRLLDELNEYAILPEDKDYNVFYLFLQNAYTGLKDYYKSSDISKITNFSMVEDPGDVKLIKKSISESINSNEKYFNKLAGNFPAYYKRITGFKHPGRQYRQNATGFQTYFLSFQKVFKEQYSFRNKIIEAAQTVVTLLESKEGKWKNENGKLLFKDGKAGAKADSLIKSMNDYSIHYYNLFDSELSMLRVALDMLNKEETKLPD